MWPVAFCLVISVSKTKANQFIKTVNSVGKNTCSSFNEFIIINCFLSFKGKGAELSKV